MYKLTFTLKQHTPLIHFLHEQDGAGLRMTEVKSRLNYFINYNTTLFDHTFLNDNRVIIEQLQNNVIYNDDSIYSLRFQNPLGTIEKFITKPSFGRGDTTPIGQRLTGSYFGNSESILFSNPEIVIKSNDKKINQVISEALKFVFAYYNFGTRTSKGFGSFTWRDETEITLKERLKKNKLNIIQVYESHITGFKIQLKEIKEKYQLLKSGRTLPQPYVKSNMFEHFVQKDIRWEKRIFKQQINSQTISSEKLLYTHEPIDVLASGDVNSWTDPIAYNYKYIRALLGLAEQNEFAVLKTYENGNPILDLNGIKQKNNLKKYVVTIKHNDDTDNKIERFASPIIFKPFNNVIFALVLPIPPEVFEKEFAFRLTLRTKNDNGGWDDRPGSEVNLNNLETPSPSEFDYLYFISTYLPRIGYTLI